nr:hypothetical protein GCM10020093_062320 [Planobispora longispora]
MSYRYGEYRDGPDPLAPPYDVRSALDRMGDSILSGSNPGHALRDLLRQGLPDADNRRGLDELLREVRRRRRELRERGRWTGPWSGPGRCWTRRSARSGRSCSPIPPTTPGSARPGSTPFRTTRPGRSRI